MNSVPENEKGTGIDELHLTDSFAPTMLEFINNVFDFCEKSPENASVFII